MEYFFITRIGDEVVGYVRAVKDGPTTLRITMTRLALQWHHTSAPTRLFENVYDFCRRRGFSDVVWNAGAVPPMTKRLIEQCGFQPMGIQGPSGRSAFSYRVRSSQTRVPDSPQQRRESVLA